LNSTTFFVRPAAQRSNGAPHKLRKQFSAELWEQAGWLIDMTMDMTRGDIDECASAYVMIDKDGNPTGASPLSLASMAIGSMSAAGLLPRNVRN
jgi:hypothetical protein